jgi:predicted double-glycine peptidase
VKALRDRYVVKQDSDYSCGAAAMATLMKYYFGDDTSETEMLNLLQSGLTEQELTIKRLKGFSLLDLKLAAQAHGYRAAGFKVTFRQLTQLTAPVLVFIEPLGYKHFAVIRGIDRGGRVYLADPSRGNLRMSVARFLDEWSGIVFVLGRADEEKIVSYPLMIPDSDRIQPELERIQSLIDLGIYTRTLPLR